MVIVGSEVEVHETKTGFTGIERVVRELHGHLAPRLFSLGIDLRPVRTREAKRDLGHRTDPYLASDPVLAQDLASLDACEALCSFDLNVRVNFPLLHRIRGERCLPTLFIIFDILPLTHPEWFPSGVARTFRIYLQQVLSVADHVVTISQAVADDIRSLGWKTRAQIHPIHLGSRFSPLPRTQVDHLSVLYSSTIEPRKGHDLLLDAFDMLLARGVDVEVSLVGKLGWEHTEVLRRIESHPTLNKRLHWYAHADDYQLARIASGCNVGVMPSRGEGFGLFLEESLSFGLPTVVSDIPVFRERPHPGVIYSPLTPGDLAEALLRAHQLPPVSFPVRTMEDFALDVLDLITEELLQSKGVAK